MIRRLLSVLSCAAASTPVTAGATPPPTPGDVIAAAPTAAWAEADARDLLAIDLAGGRRVVVMLAPAWAPAHVANIRALARAGWYDGVAIDRVQDNYVTQWGDADGHKPLPPGLNTKPAAEYERPAAGSAATPLAVRDSYAARVALAGPFPAAGNGRHIWLTHCYGMVGVGRDLPPDTGSGAELYTVIGHAPRHLDRNLAVIGRVVAGMDVLSALPRGLGALGMYADPHQRVPILRARIVADLPAAERPVVQWLRPDSASFRAWVRARSARRDAFFVRPANAIDLCNALPPVRVSGGVS